MQKLKKLLFETHRNATIWTVVYFAAIFLLFWILFGFNFLSPNDWARLWSAHLRGFGGFVFGIFLIAFIPAYIATVSVIIRTKKPLFMINEKRKTKDEVAEETPEPVAEEPERPLPAGLPNELRGSFLNMRKNGKNNFCAPPKSMGDDSLPHPATDAATMPASGTEQNNPTKPEPEQKENPFPIPDDFGIDAPDTTTTAPVFKEISFGDTPETKDENIEFRDGMAIATHDDSDLWIADDSEWFATGKQKPSPIAAAIAAADANRLKPAIHLIATNIMDLDKKIAEWESAGITVITDKKDK